MIWSFSVYRKASATELEVQLFWEGRKVQKTKLFLELLSKVKTKWEILFKIFVASSEYLNNIIKPTTIYSCTYGWKSIERLEFQSHKLSCRLAYMLYNTVITMRGIFSKVLGTLEMWWYTSKISRTLVEKPQLINCPTLSKAKFAARKLIQQTSSNS